MLALLDAAQEVPLPLTSLHPILNPRRRSLVRGNIIVLGSLALASLLSGAPHLHTSPVLLLPLLGCLLGTVDTVRCLQKRWSFYHGGVLLCLYMDVMAITLVLFLLLYPYFVGSTAGH